MEKRENRGKEKESRLNDPFSSLFTEDVETANAEQGREQDSPERINFLRRSPIGNYSIIDIVADDGWKAPVYYSAARNCKIAQQIATRNTLDTQTKSTHITFGVLILKIIYFSELFSRSLSLSLSKEVMTIDPLLQRRRRSISANSQRIF